MNITHFTIMQDGHQYVGSVTIKKQAVHVAQSRVARAGRPVFVTAHVDNGRVREVVYHSDGTIKRLWNIATELQSLRQGGKTSK